jgi:hypothetical protein
MVGQSEATSTMRLFALTLLISFRLFCSQAMAQSTCMFALLGCPGGFASDSKIASPCPHVLIKGLSHSLVPRLCSTVLQIQLRTQMLCSLHPLRNPLLPRRDAHPNRQELRGLRHRNPHHLRLPDHHPHVLCCVERRARGVHVPCRRRLLFPTAVR